MTKFNAWYCGPNHDGSYRLPRRTYDLLCTRLRPFRNREAAMALAVFVCRVWTSPSGWGQAFPLDRRAMHSEFGDRPHREYERTLPLDLTEAQIRGAIKTLEAIAFLRREQTEGSAYQKRPFGVPKEHHRIRRKPILWRIGHDFEGPLAHAKTVSEKSPIRREYINTTLDRFLNPEKIEIKGNLFMGEQEGLMNFIDLAAISRKIRRSRQLWD